MTRALKVTLAVILMCGGLRAHAGQTEFPYSDATQIIANAHQISTLADGIATMVSTLQDAAHTHSTYQANRILGLAKNHLMLGDYDRAIELITQDLSTSQSYDLKTTERAYRLLYEAYRRSRRFTEAARVCNYALTRAYPLKKDDTQTFDLDERWALSCSLSFVYATRPNQKNLSGVRDDELINFVYSPLFKAKRELNLPRIMFEAVALNNVSKTKDALSLLNEALSEGAQKDPWRARALFLAGVLNQKLGQKMEALKVLRAAVNDWPDAAAPTLVADKYSQYLSHRALAQISFSEGKFAAAEHFYTAALSDKDIFLKPKENETFSPDSFREGNEDDLRWELGHLYFLEDKYREAKAEFEKLLKTKIEAAQQTNKDIDPRALEYAKILARFGDQSSLSRNLLADLKIAGERDINFAEAILKSKMSEDEGELQNGFVKLQAIASKHGVDFAELDQLKLFSDVFQRGKRDLQNLYRDLEDVLGPLDSKNDGLEAQHSAALLRLLDLQTQFEEQLARLDQMSRDLWSGTQKTIRYADLARLELRRRAVADSDLVSELRKNNQQKEINSSLESTLDSVNKTFIESQSLLASLNATNFMLNVGEQLETGDAKALRLNFNSVEQSIHRQEQAAHSAVLNYRLQELLYSSQQTQVDSLKRRFVAFSKTARELFELHSRMAALPSKDTRDVFLRCWSQMLEAELTLTHAVKAAERASREARSDVVDRARQIVHLADVESKGLEKLRSLYKQEFLRLLRRTAKKIEPILSAYNADIQLTAAHQALADERGVQDDLEGKKRERQERAGWFRTLQESIVGGYSR